MPGNLVQLPESHLTRILFGQILRRIERLVCHPPDSTARRSGIGAGRSEVSLEGGVTGGQPSQDLNQRAGVAITALSRGRRGHHGATRRF